MNVGTERPQSAAPNGFTSGPERRIAPLFGVTTSPQLERVWGEMTWIVVFIYRNLFPGETNDKAVFFEEKG